ncbi:AHH domain-containing protein [Roseofilum sp. BLCC_M91]|uniref:AHH domain-containing protein n=1 Tax=Roseofilum halophilum BLCC-M91 TaxID=3022259 RepID=A0ABT7BEH6_9CYAN|nr:AHH domain-containing protein [Roseofilum halophilum]MDJ1177580.1 AHH domain-containing protein [Roseofilum halophilum BLCC-M91]
MGFQLFKMNVPRNSPILKHLSIQPGKYILKWDNVNGDLIFLSQRGTEKLALKLSPEEFKMMQLMMDNLTDKYTFDEEKLKEFVKRSGGFSSKVKDYVGHHIIPLDLFKTSKLLLAVSPNNKKGNPIHINFYENHPANRLPLPATFHKGSHGSYSNFVEDCLEGEWSDIVKFGLENDRSHIVEIIYQIIIFLKDKIREMRKDGLVSINDI